MMASSYVPVDNVLDSDEVNTQLNLVSDVVSKSLDSAGLASAIDSVKFEPYPVGSYYTQYPKIESIVESIAFPVEERPDYLFGGHWEALDVPATVFKTLQDAQAQYSGSSSMYSGLVLKAGQVSASSFVNPVPDCPQRFKASSSLATDSVLASQVPTYGSFSSYVMSDPVGQFHKARLISKLPAVPFADYDFSLDKYKHILKDNLFSLPLALASFFTRLILETVVVYCFNYFWLCFYPTWQRHIIWTQTSTMVAGNGAPFWTPMATAYYSATRKSSWNDFGNSPRGLGQPNDALIAKVQLKLVAFSTGFLAVVAATTALEVLFPNSDLSDFDDAVLLLDQLNYIQEALGSPPELPVKPNSKDGFFSFLTYLNSMSSYMNEIAGLSSAGLPVPTYPPVAGNIFLQWVATTMSEPYTVDFYKDPSDFYWYLVQKPSGHIQVVYDRFPLDDSENGGWPSPPGNQSFTLARLRQYYQDYVDSIEQQKAAVIQRILSFCVNLVTKLAVVIGGIELTNKLVLLFRSMFEASPAPTPPTAPTPPAAPPAPPTAPVAPQAPVRIELPKIDITELFNCIPWATVAAAGASGASAIISRALEGYLNGLVGRAVSAALSDPLYALASTAMIESARRAATQAALTASRKGAAAIASAVSSILARGAVSVSVLSTVSLGMLVAQSIIAVEDGLVIAAMAHNGLTSQQIADRLRQRLEDNKKIFSLDFLPDSVQGLIDPSFISNIVLELAVAYFDVKTAMELEYERQLEEYARQNQGYAAALAQYNRDMAAYEQAMAAYKLASDKYEQDMKRYYDEYEIYLRKKAKYEQDMEDYKAMLQATTIVESANTKPNNRKVMAKSFRINITFALHVFHWLIIFSLPSVINLILNSGKTGDSFKKKVVSTSRYAYARIYSDRNLPYPRFKSLSYIVWRRVG